MKVKLILIQEIYDDDYGIKFVKDIIKEQDFEEITVEELNLLKQNLFSIPVPYADNGSYYWNIIIQDDEPIKNRIQSIKDFLETEKMKRAKEKLEKEEKRKKKEELAKKKTKEEEIALLEELKKKYEK